MQTAADPPNLCAEENEQDAYTATPMESMVRVIRARVGIYGFCIMEMNRGAVKIQSEEKQIGLYKMGLSFLIRFTLSCSVFRDGAAYFLSPVSAFV